jgi:glycerol kinase
MIPFLLWNNHVVAFATFRPSAPWRATCFRRYGTTSMDSTEHYKDYPMNVVIDKEVLQSARHEKLVASIDQGTSSTRFMVFTQEARILASAQVEHTQYYPQGPNKVGWHEHDGLEIWFRCRSCIQVLTDELQKFNVHWTRQLQGIGITNQRETLLAWNAKTGIPYHHAIVWDDVRTSGIARMLANKRVDKFRKRTGLPLASYFSRTKVRWLIDNVPQLRQDLNDKDARQHVRFGTMDVWLMYQLTGKPIDNEGACGANVGGVHVTDVTNASRWLFLDIHKVQWDPKLIRQICDMDIPMECFPSICPSSHVYGKVSEAVPALQNVPLAAILGDQQSALFAQCAHHAGEAKNTYGTGAFLMMNTGTNIIQSQSGLLTTISYQIGSNGPVHYALEGSVSHCGSTIQWLRDQLNIISEAKQADDLASQLEQNGGLYFVPAFSGLFTPFWRSDARGCIVGMTASHDKRHICRAALEASCYQTREVFDAMYADSNVVLSSLRVDGGGTQSNMMMQFQADILDVPVEMPQIMETTALGAAFAAGIATGVLKDINDIRGYWQISKTFYPAMDAAERDRNWAGWKKAVDRSLGWVEPPEPLTESLRKRRVFSLLRLKLNRARRRYIIKILRTTRNIL